WEPLDTLMGTPSTDRQSSSHTQSCPKSPASDADTLPAEPDRVSRLPQRPSRRATCVLTPWRLLWEVGRCRRDDASPRATRWCGGLGSATWLGCTLRPSTACRAVVLTRRPDRCVRRRHSGLGPSTYPHSTEQQPPPAEHPGSHVPHRVAAQVGSQVQLLVH